MQQSKKQLAYKLVVSDFDGTLVNEDGSILESTKRTINEYRENGGNFAISTGRLPEAIIDRAQELGLKGAVSCCQGAIIVDIQSKEVLFSDTIPNKTAVKICKKMEELGLHIHAYDLWEYYCNMDDDALKFYKKATGTTPNLVLDKPLSKVLEEKGIGVYKMMVMVEPKDVPFVFERLEKENFEGCAVTKSGDFLVEVINANYSKGTAISFLANYYGVSVENTIAVGDQWNDIPMIEVAGLGAAVANADNKLKAAADVVLSATNEQGAVGEVITRFAYQKED